MSKQNRRRFLQAGARGAAGLMAGTFLSNQKLHAGEKGAKRPNILFAIADDWSWPHAGAYGDPVIQTPAFDRVAREGCLFNHVFAAAPQCAPNRASILTGRNIWQNEEAGTHSSYFPKKLKVFPDLLEQSGYFVGYTGKPWGPGNWKDSGWERNPAGPGFNSRRMDSVPANGIRNLDYAGNFKEFMDERPEDQPFCFWYGASEPHRGYEKGSGVEAGKSIKKVKVPGFLPDVEEVRSDILDYYVEVEWFDRHLGDMLDYLESIGELDNTLVVVTSDNGMPFPRAKANLYEYGVHMPMAVRWPGKIKAGRNVDDLISFIDLAPTFLDVAGVEIPDSMSGKSFKDVLLSKKNGLVNPARDTVYFGRERHSHSRFDNLGYPARAIRTHDYLYIWNCKPERWPAGTPDYYHDIDGCPTLDYLLEHKTDEDIKPYFQMACAKRLEEELFNIKDDPACLTNLVDNPTYSKVKNKLKDALMDKLKKQNDPRVIGTGDVFESYPRFGSMRAYLGGFHQRGEYNPKYQ